MGDVNSEIFGRLTRIEQDVAVIKERTTFLPDHERRIRDLEAKEARRGGVIAALSTICSVVGAAFMWLMQHFIKGGS